MHADLDEFYAVADPQGQKFLPRMLMKASNVPQPEPGPLRGGIVNASEMAQKDTVLRVERDQSGKLTGAVAHKI